MGDNSKIQWTQATWNPVTGCSKVSPGCAHCYAEREWPRLAGNPKTVYHGRKFTDVQCHPERLDQPVNWKRPRMIFVNSMSDLFHPDVPFKFIWSVWWRMATAKQHIFQVLTKRPERMKEFFEWMKVQELKVETYLPHVWLGVTAENQEQADIRIPILLQIPDIPTVRFVSVEPMLGPVSLYSEALGDPLCRCGGCMSIAKDSPRIDWVICGGETGPGARPMHPDWARGLRDQCQAAGVPFFFKQWGEWIPSYDAGERCEEADQYKRTFGKCWSQTKTYYKFPDGQGMVLVGKKAAGRLLDGREWNEMPGVQIR